MDVRGRSHVRRRIVLATSHDKNTSSSHSTVGLALRRMFCALTCSTAPLQEHPVQRLIAEITQIAHDAFHHVAIARIGAPRD